MEQSHLMRLPSPNLLTLLGPDGSLVKKRLVHRFDPDLPRRAFVQQLP
jgi:hypothetical protein